MNFTREADSHRYFRSSFKNNFRYKMNNKYRVQRENRFVMVKQYSKATLLRIV